MLHYAIRRDTSSRGRPRSDRRLRALAVLTAVGLAVAACSTGAGSPAPSAPAGASTAPSAQSSAAAPDYPTGDLSIMAPAAYTRGHGLPPR